MQHFELILAQVASKCEYKYGFNGAEGYEYMSVKDNLKWNDLSTKHYTHIVMQIGRFMAMDDKKFNTELVKHNKMPDNELANALISAFGDGK